ncbi:MAG: peptidoglycan-binding protein [Rhizobium sp.]|nr:peptidoglycan-binding protein [Rhizobium sp.]
MAQPKRKSPDRKPSGKMAARKKGPSIASRMLASTVASIARHPRLLGGMATFGVVFSVVAANALWYQPKHHPAPLLATRMFESDTHNTVKTRTQAVEEATAEPGVTTFRIERQNDDSHLEEVPVDASIQVASPLIREVQQALARRGLYDGPADGLTGPRTTSAILFFQETEGLEQTGDASVGLLSRIKARDTAVAVIPDERPSPDVTASTKTRTKTSDDIADLIREADAEPAVRTRSINADVASATDKPISPEKVMKIQKALSRFAYAKVKVDGVAGEATRAAIRAFEKNYNLPVTGEPSERVIRKLKSIGAI